MVMFNGNITKPLDTGVPHFKTNPNRKSGKLGKYEEKHHLVHIQYIAMENGTCFSMRNPFQTW